MADPVQLELNLVGGTPLASIPDTDMAYARERGRSANDVQVGGSHYKKHAIQPWDAIIDWGLGFLDGNVVKYIARWRNKDGVKDLKKARHYLDKLIEHEEAISGMN